MADSGLYVGQPQKLDMSSFEINVSTAWLLSMIFAEACPFGVRRSCYTPSFWWSFLRIRVPSDGAFLFAQVWAEADDSEGAFQTKHVMCLYWTPSRYPPWWDTGDIGLAQELGIIRTFSLDVRLPSYLFRCSVSWQPLSVGGGFRCSLRSPLLKFLMVWPVALVSHGASRCNVKYPIVSDPNREIIKELNMVDPDEKDSTGVSLPSRALHIVLRAVDSLQTAAKHRVATPADWKRGEPVVISPSVSDEDAKKMFPRGFDTADLPSKKGYLRFTTIHD
ncbi:hypothetical protein Taro_043875 [Colocasia esculenta]|uniref:thioredoxin-dependent peroxiredoxin n=1 Tax=Colocasia esculenta TaxID=4460 RepID=A0A843WM76_COLES|nr:hypothetical protein [Colocasia esculenta]